MKVLVLLATAVVAALAAPTDKCPAVMSAEGLSLRFPGAVAHAIHSITLQDIRHYFEPLATAENNIPMVNMDLSGTTAIFFHAPDIPRNEKFNFMGIKIADQVLSHMDNKDYDVRGYNTLEKLVHSLHMHDVWTNIQMHYQALKQTPPSDSDFCPCVRDIESNGILRMLRFIALKLREPELMYGKHEVLNNGTVSWDNNAYNYGFIVKTDVEAKLPNENQVIPKLENEKAWSFWRNLMENIAENDHKEVASFIYCVLNKDA